MNDTNTTVAAPESDEQPMNAYLVRLGLPVMAPSMPSAIETFMDMANNGSWAFTVETAEGRHTVDVAMSDDGRVMDMLPLSFHSNDAEETNLYYVLHGRCDENTLDSVVEATSPEQAIKLWQEYWVKELELDEPPTARLVYLLPERRGEPGVVEWGIGRAPCALVVYDKGAGAEE